jgi:glycosyltransferase involved in cell wall biosynthesis
MNPRFVSIVVFGKDTNQDTVLTFETIFKAIAHISDLEYEFILVDDGSRESLEKFLPSAFHKKIRVAVHGKSLGIGDCMLTGCKLAMYESILFIPGHNVFSEEAIRRALCLVDIEPIILGVRIGNGARPRIKKISSIVFRNILRLSTNRYILDPHGLPGYPKSLILDALPPGANHALHVYILREMNRRNLSLVQFQAPINSNYKDSLKVSPTNYLSYFKNVWSVVRILFRNSKHNAIHSKLFR